jgi:hypothetical protein
MRCLKETSPAMKPLLETMARLPGVDPLSTSEDRIDGRYKLTFAVDALAGGWRSLSMVALACDNPCGDDVLLTCSTLGSSPESIAFELHGSSTTPELIDHELRRVVTAYDWELMPG